MIQTFSLLNLDAVLSYVENYAAKVCCFLAESGASRTSEIHVASIPPLLLSQVLEQVCCAAILTDQCVPQVEDSPVGVSGVGCDCRDCNSGDFL